MKTKKTTFFTASNVELRNFKGIADFHKRLDGDSCLVIGSEGAGKTNILQSIFMILKQYPSAILKQGEEDGSAQVEISKGETKYMFKFSFEEGEPPKMKTLIEGERVTMARQSEIIKSLTPQTFSLDDLIVAKGQSQVDIVLKAFDIDVGVEKEAYKEAFDERKLAKRSLEENSHFQIKEEVKEIDTKALRKEVNDNNATKELRLLAETKMKGYNERMEELDEEAIALKKKIDDLQELVTKGEKYLKEQPVPKDTVKLEEKLSTAEVTNEQALDYKNYLEKVKIKAKKQTIVQKNETTLKEASKAIVDKINSAKLPVPKLNITTTISESSGRINSVLTYGGLPFDADSINTAERIAIAAKLQMSLFKSGNLGILTLNAGSVGNNTIKSISEECAKRDLQVLWELTSKDDDKKLEIVTVLKK